jgi:hypothetical protein
MVCRLQLLLVLARAVIHRFDYLHGQVPVFISHRNRMGRLYPQALRSLFVAYYDSQGYSGGMRPRPHTGDSSSQADFQLTTKLVNFIVFKITPLHGPHRKHRSSIVARVSISAGTRLRSHCLKTGCITPLFYGACVGAHCGRYLATAHVYRVTP